MCSAISSETIMTSPACSLCRKILVTGQGKCSYNKVTWNKHEIFEDFFEEIGYQLDELHYICQPCNRLFSRRLKIENEYQNRHELISHLINPNFKLASSCVISKDVATSHCSLFGTPRRQTPKRGIKTLRLTPVKARKSLFKATTKRSLSKTPVKVKRHKQSASLPKGVQFHPIMPKVVIPSLVTKDAVTQTTIATKDEGSQSVIVTYNTSTSTPTPTISTKTTQTVNTHEKPIHGAKVRFHSFIYHFFNYADTFITIIGTFYTTAHILPY